MIFEYPLYKGYSGNKKTKIMHCWLFLFPTIIVPWKHLTTKRKKLRANHVLKEEQPRKIIALDSTTSLERSLGELNKKKNYRNYWGHAMTLNDFMSWRIQLQKIDGWSTQQKCVYFLYCSSEAIWWVSSCKWYVYESGLICLVLENLFCATNFQSTQADLGASDVFFSPKMAAMKRHKLFWSSAESGRVLKGLHGIFLGGDGVILSQKCHGKCCSNKMFGRISAEIIPWGLMVL